ncbi:DUF397 domain-containing protein [Nocardia nova]|nr:DUF397 domain-containing protein [Nocardia nova]
MTVDLSGAEWFKSSHSGGGNDCVEIAHLAGGFVGVRDSKNPDGATLIFTSVDWNSFVEHVKGEVFRRF